MANPARVLGARRAWLPRVFGVLALLSTSACISFEFDRVDRHSPPPPAALASLEPGVTTLDQCLARLGAPWRVREINGQSELIWGWERNGAWNTTLSVPISDRGSSNFSYSQEAVGGEGITLRFDEHWVLLQQRSGKLKDLLVLRAAPPRLVERRPAAR